MNRKREIKKTVYKILQEDEYARRDDNYLILRVVQELEPSIAGTAFSNVMQQLSFRGISLEGITRSRRKFFEEHPELKVEKAEKARREKEEEYREEYRSMCHIFIRRGSMLVKSSLKEIVEHIVKDDIKITDNSCCGNCSKCGECCTNFLPVTQKEIEIIQEYVIANKIRPQKQMLVMQNRLTCPYYNGKKCLIYEVRPLICREFYCYKKPTAELGKKFLEEDFITVDMWAIAEEIDKYFKER